MRIRWPSYTHTTGLDTQALAYIDIHWPTYKYAGLHTIRWPTYTYTGLHTNTLAYIHIRWPTYTYAGLHTNTLAYRKNLYMTIYIYRYIHTYIYTYT